MQVSSKQNTTPHDVLSSFESDCVPSCPRLTMVCDSSFPPEGSLCCHLVGEAKVQPPSLTPSIPRWCGWVCVLHLTLPERSSSAASSFFLSPAWTPGASSLCQQHPCLPRSLLTLPCTSLLPLPLPSPVGMPLGKSGASAGYSPHCVLTAPSARCFSLCLLLPFLASSTRVVTSPFPFGLHLSG